MLPVPVRLPQPGFGDAIYDKRLQKPSSLVFIIPYVACFLKVLLDLRSVECPGVSMQLTPGGWGIMGLWIVVIK